MVFIHNKYNKKIKYKIRVKFKMNMTISHKQTHKMYIRQVRVIKYKEMIPFKLNKQYQLDERKPCFQIL